MDVEFADDRLSLIETDRAAETSLPVAVIQSARQRLTLIRAAPDVQTLRNWKSLGYGQAQDSQNGEQAVTINNQWRMLLRLDDPVSPTKVTVTGVKEQREPEGTAR